MANPEDVNGIDANGQERLRQETEEREVRGLQRLHSQPSNRIKHVICIDSIDGSCQIMDADYLGST